jgi:hypothetical protein
MQAYSHSDRLGDDPEALLRPERIQKNICEGNNIFGMLPEAYTFLDLFARWKGTKIRQLTAVRALLSGLWLGTDGSCSATLRRLFGWTQKNMLIYFRGDACGSNRLQILPAIYDDLVGSLRDPGLCFR